ncbi:MAG: tRNA (adenosine(37)-N6)-threonylcarbamoyltransferase complex dimerization subunit type 1 TsaB [Pirellulaceae bacterium]
MLNLAIECSGTSGSVTLADGLQEIAFQPLPSELGSVQTLAHTIANILGDNRVSAPQLISVTTGPGSFTGLRVGLSTAKMLALGWGVPIVGVDSLAAIALQSSATHLSQAKPTVVLAIMNAFRQQVFASAWMHTDSLTCLAASQVLEARVWQQAPDGWLDTEWTSSSPDFLVTGPGLQQYMPDLSKLNSGSVAPAHLWTPRASEVAVLGWQEFLAGRATSAAGLQANYVRGAAAEETIRSRSS